MLDSVLELMSSRHLGTTMGTATQQLKHKHENLGNATKGPS